MKLEIEFGSVVDLKIKLHKLLTGLELEQESPIGLPSEPVSHHLPQTTGSVEQDQTIVPTGTPSREDLKPRRTRRTKAEIEAEKKATSVEQMAPLADRPANSRPVTQGFLVDTNPNLPQLPKELPAAPSTEPAIDRASQLQHFKMNFTQTVFFLLQEKKIDQDYIAEKMRYYNLKDLTTMTKDEKMTEHFFNTLVTEGKL